MYTLLRLEDKHFTDGRHSRAIEWNEDGTFKEDHGEYPRLGCSMMVGYGVATHWLTTTIQEILEQTEDYVKFKTKNSTYEWRKLPDPKESD